MSITQSPPASEKWLTPPQIARMLGIDTAKILRWIRSGELVAINLAASSTSQRPRYKIDPADFERFKEHRRQQPPPSPRLPATKAFTSKVRSYV